MVDVAKPLEAQIEFFKKAGVDISTPGFYDDPKFLELEKKEPNVLRNYASFVKQNKYSDSYLLEAERKIIVICKALYEQLKLDKRKGACVDMSIVLSKILEKVGIWNYSVKGSLTINFPENSGLPQAFFYSLDGNPIISAGHAWVAAPPFEIIDLTIKHQIFTNKKANFYLPEYILEKNGNTTEIDLADIIEPDILKFLKLRNRGDFKKILKDIGSDLFPFMNYFKPQTYGINGMGFKYTPVGIGAPDLPLEEITSLRLNGKFGYEIYEQIIRKKL